MIGDLLERVKAGNDPQAEAMTRLATIIYPWVRRTVRAHLSGRERRWIGVDDACQEIMYRIVRRMKTVEFRGTGALVAWVSLVSSTTLRMLVNKMAAQKRGFKRLAPNDEPLAGARDYDAEAAEGLEPDTEERLRAILTRLSPLEAAVIDAVILRGGHRVTVTTQLGVSERTVRRALASALHHIITQLECPGPPDSA
ncbi:MAG: ECF-type sigma factor [Planctomycetota bacterium]